MYCIDVLKYIDILMKYNDIFLPLFQINYFITAIDVTLMYKYVKYNENIFLNVLLFLKVVEIF